MSEAEVLNWFRDTPVGGAVRQIYWLFPMLETIHFIGLCMLIGSMLFIDLRMLGVGRLVPVRLVLKFIPLAIAGFVLAMLSGAAMFSNLPTDYWPNPGFRLKMLLILVAGANALWFEFAERRRVSVLVDTEEIDKAAKISAALSLTIWAFVIVLGRLLPYTGTSA